MEVEEQPVQSSEAAPRPQVATKARPAPAAAGLVDPYHLGLPDLKPLFADRKSRPQVETYSPGSAGKIGSPPSARLSSPRTVRERVVLPEVPSERRPGERPESLKRSVKQRAPPKAVWGEETLQSPMKPSPRKPEDDSQQYSQLLDELTEALYALTLWTDRLGSSGPTGEAYMQKQQQYAAQIDKILGKLQKLSLPKKADMIHKQSVLDALHKFHQRTMEWQKEREDLRERAAFLEQEKEREKDKVRSLIGERDEADRQGSLMDTQQPHPTSGEDFATAMKETGAGEEGKEQLMLQVQYMEKKILKLREKLKRRTREVALLAEPPPPGSDHEHVDLLYASREELVAEVGWLRAELNRIQTDLRITRERLERQKARFESEARSLEDQLRDQSLLVEAQGSIESLKKRLVDAQAQMASLEAEKEAALASVELANKLKANAEERMKEMIFAKENERVEFLADQRVMQNQVDELQRELQLSEKKLEDLNQEIGQAKEQRILDLEKELSATEQALQEKDTALESLKALHDQIEGELQEQLQAARDEAAAAQAAPAPLQIAEEPAVEPQEEEEAAEPQQEQAAEPQQEQAEAPGAIAEEEAKGEAVPAEAEADREAEGEEQPEESAVEGKEEKEAEEVAEAAAEPAAPKAEFKPMETQTSGLAMGEEKEKAALKPMETQTSGTLMDETRREGQVMETQTSGELPSEAPPKGELKPMETQTSGLAMKDEEVEEEGEKEKVELKGMETQTALQEVQPMETQTSGEIVMKGEEEEEEEGKVGAAMETQTSRQWLEAQKTTQTEYNATEMAAQTDVQSGEGSSAVAGMPPPTQPAPPADADALEKEVYELKQALDATSKEKLRLSDEAEALKKTLESAQDVMASRLNELQEALQKAESDTEIRIDEAKRVKEEELQKAQEEHARKIDEMRSSLQAEKKRAVDRETIKLQNQLQQKEDEFENYRAQSVQEVTHLANRSEFLAQELIRAQETSEFLRMQKEFKGSFYITVRKKAYQQAGLIQYLAVSLDINTNRIRVLEETELPEDTMHEEILDTHGRSLKDGSIVWASTTTKGPGARPPPLGKEAQRAEQPMTQGDEDMEDQDLSPHPFSASSVELHRTRDRVQRPQAPSRPLLNEPEEEQPEGAAAEFSQPTIPYPPPPRLDVDDDDDIKKRKAKPFNPNFGDNPLVRVFCEIADDPSAAESIDDLLRKLSNCVAEGGSILDDIGVWGVCILRGTLTAPYQWPAEATELIGRKGRAVSSHYLVLTAYRMIEPFCVKLVGYDNETGGNYLVHVLIDDVRVLVGTKTNLFRDSNMIHELVEVLSESLRVVKKDRIEILCAVENVAAPPTVLNDIDMADEAKDSIDHRNKTRRLVAGTPPITPLFPTRPRRPAPTLPSPSLPPTSAAPDVRVWDDLIVAGGRFFHFWIKRNPLVDGKDASGRVAMVGVTEAASCATARLTVPLAGPRLGNGRALVAPPHNLTLFAESHQFGELLFLLAAEELHSQQAVAVRVAWASLVSAAQAGRVEAITAQREAYAQTVLLTQDFTKVLSHPHPEQRIRLALPPPSNRRDQLLAFLQSELIEDALPAGAAETGPRIAGEEAEETHEEREEAPRVVEEPGEGEDGVLRPVEVVDERERMRLAVEEELTHKALQSREKPLLTVERTYESFPVKPPPTTAAAAAAAAGETKEDETQAAEAAEAPEAKEKAAEEEAIEEVPLPTLCRATVAVYERLRPFIHFIVTATPTHGTSAQRGTYLVDSTRLYHMPSLVSRAMTGKGGGSSHLNLRDAKVRDAVAYELAKGVRLTEGDAGRLVIDLTPESVLSASDGFSRRAMETPARDKGETDPLTAEECHKLMTHEIDEALIVRERTVALHLQQKEIDDGIAPAVSGPLLIALYDEPKAPLAAVCVHNILVVAFSKWEQRYFSLRLNDRSLGSILPSDVHSLLDPAEKPALLERIIQSIEITPLETAGQDIQRALVCRSLPAGAPEPVEPAEAPPEDEKESPFAVTSEAKPADGVSVRRGPLAVGGSPLEAGMASVQGTGWKRLYKTQETLTEGEKGVVMTVDSKREYGIKEWHRLGVYWPTHRYPLQVLMPTKDDMQPQKLYIEYRSVGDNDYYIAMNESSFPHSVTYIVHNYTSKKEARFTLHDEAIYTLVERSLREKVAQIVEQLLRFGTLGENGEFADSIKDMSAGQELYPSDESQRLLSTHVPLITFPFKPRDSTFEVDSEVVFSCSRSVRPNGGLRPPTQRGGGTPPQAKPDGEAKYVLHFSISKKTYCQDFLLAFEVSRTGGSAANGEEDGGGVYFLPLGDKLSSVPLGVYTEIKHVGGLRLAIVVVDDFNPRVLRIAIYEPSHQFAFHCLIHDKHSDQLMQAMKTKEQLEMDEKYPEESLTPKALTSLSSVPFPRAFPPRIQLLRFFQRYFAVKAPFKPSLLKGGDFVRGTPERRPALKDVDTDRLHRGTHRLPSGLSGILTLLRERGADGTFRFKVLFSDPLTNKEMVTHVVNPTLDSVLTTAGLQPSADVKAEDIESKRSELVDVIVSRMRVLPDGRTLEVSGPAHPLPSPRQSLARIEGSQPADAQAVSLPPPPAVPATTQAGVPPAQRARWAALPCDDSCRAAVKEHDVPFDPQHPRIRVEVFEGTFPRDTVMYTFNFRLRISDWRSGQVVWIGDVHETDLHPWLLRSQALHLLNPSRESDLIQCVGLHAFSKQGSDEVSFMPVDFAAYPHFMPDGEPKADDAEEA
ncbi:unnamed protein product [Vitrella brassicaformis CCMP3155]|uniref:Uncharacterized protein n=4 Tax=Vitrella brassicaformis TaxID=1169539 RepID=A0A0G4EY31_VITBC|nr:unnamed protein product [Vitrella brassicaformis CCMP3155]|eukprot:CEM04244.1 unnamed protein product [Vitrella brassicaformis CCMP3155]